jgi:DNA polymerase-3 subunit gamma/tau
LYRKYRPAVFDDVKGQDVIVRTLRNQIRTGRIAHAYLFCGSRGTGKTTAAKIFARAVNCENQQDGNPCGECGSCRAIREGRSMNVIEMDAASRNGVDDFRQIIEEIEYPPTSGKYKVYIIDEVHMLSGAAFNAFLKTLEEPPSYAIFLLATTDPQKLPVTILSRCQRYDFRRISTEIISDHLREVLEKEKIGAEEEAVRYIARKAEGGMRDALSLADQCISFFLGEKLTYEHVLEVLGTVDTEVYRRMLHDAAMGDASGLLAVFNSLIMDGREVRQIIGDFTWYIRDLLLFMASGGSSESLTLVEENREDLLRDSEGMSEARLMYYIRILSDLSGSLRNASNRRILAELALIRLCRPETDTGDYNALNIRMERLEQQIREGGFVRSPAEGSPAQPVRSGGGEDLPGPMPAAEGEKEPEPPEDEEPGFVTPELFQRIRGQWTMTVSRISEPGVAAVMRSYAEPFFRPEEPAVLFVVWHAFWEAYRSNEKVRLELEKLLEEKYESRLTVRFLSDREAREDSSLKKVPESKVDALIRQGVNFTVEMEDE